MVGFPLNPLKVKLLAGDLRAFQFLLSSMPGKVLWTLDPLGSKSNPLGLQLPRRSDKC